MRQGRSASRLGSKEVSSMQKPPRYLVATDGSPAAREAVRQAVELARESGATLSILYVRHAPLPVLGDPFYERTLSEELARGRAIVEAAAATVRKAGVATEVDTLEGNPATQIVELARRRRADMIIVGSRGRGAVAGTLLGSVSKAVVNSADCPVLVVRPTAPSRQAA
jgi:nucleotide-binding universal stress UspA family protein